MEPINLFSGATGLNTVVDPVRLPYNADSGVSDLGAAVNVRIDDTGRISRVDGYSKQLSGSYHSVFCDGYDCFVGKGTSLMQIGIDLSETGIRSGMSGDRIAYAQDVYLYYSNGTDNGLIKNGLSYSWDVSTYYGPETTKDFRDVPVGHHLAFAYGRAFIARDNILWWTEVYNFGLIDRALNFVMFPSKILMVKPVEEGIFVSDEKKTFFLRGTNPHTFLQRIVAPYPAYEWSDAIDYVSGIEIGLDIGSNALGLCAFWSSPEGAILGSPSGQLVNLNKSKIIYPQTGSSGASLIRGYDFLHTIT